MEQYIKESEANNNYLTYQGPQKIRSPNSNNPYNERYLYQAPEGLRRDYESMYKALEFQTQQKLVGLEQFKSETQNEVQFYKEENLKFQQQFDKVLEDNKVLYLRCKELEQFMMENSPAFKGQYAGLIQENDYLRKQNYQLSQGQVPNNPLASNQGFEDSTLLGARSANRLQAQQREIEDLKKENYDLKLRLQAQIQDKGLPYSRVQMASPERPPVSLVYSPQRPAMRAPESYCDQIINQNEQHNRAILDRCKSIVTQHNYY